MSTTGFRSTPPSCSASRMIRLTQYGEDEPFAFQSSVSTDQSHTFIRRCCARLSVVELYEPYGGRNVHGPPPTTCCCSAVSRSISVACPDGDKVVRSA